MPGLVLIGYDRSPAAGHAIEAAATLVSATEAIVVHVWSPTIGGASMALPGTGPPPLQDETALEVEAWRIAEEGAALAAEAGLRARPAVECGTRPEIGDLLAALADEYDADLVLVGRRRVSRLEAAVFGNAAQDTVRASRRPVLVVPSREAQVERCSIVRLPPRGWRPRGGAAGLPGRPR
jgi:nucleotide-binding universal stress UspA family protein